MKITNFTGFKQIL